MVEAVYITPCKTIDTFHFTWHWRQAEWCPGVIEALSCSFSIDLAGVALQFSCCAEVKMIRQLNTGLCFLNIVICARYLYNVFFFYLPCYSFVFELILSKYVHECNENGTLSSVNLVSMCPQPQWNREIICMPVGSIMYSCKNTDAFCVDFCLKKLFWKLVLNRTLFQQWLPQGIFNTSSTLLVTECSPEIAVPCSYFSFIKLLGWAVFSLRFVHCFRYLCLIKSNVLMFFLNFHCAITSI